MGYTLTTHDCHESKEDRFFGSIEWRFVNEPTDGAWMLYTGDVFLDVVYCPFCGEKLSPPQQINP